MNTNITIRRILALLLAVCLILPGTALAAGGGKGKKNFNEGQKYEAAQQWDLAAQAYALAVSAEPNNPEYRLHYLRSLQQASLMYVKRGDALAEQNDFAGAYTAYRMAYQFDQGNEVARVKMEGMLDQQKSLASGVEPATYTKSGNVKPTSDIQIATKQRNRDLLQNVAFKDASFKSVVTTLGKQLGLNVMFDDQVKDDKITVDMNDVTLAKAMDNILFMKKYTFEQMDRRTIIVYQDNATNKPRFEKLMVKAFYLGNITANQARNVVTLALGPQRQVQTLDQGGGGPNAAGGAGGNVLLVKATPQELQVVQQLLEMVDKNKNEVVLDVEIYEVSHDSMLQIGNQIAKSQQQLNTVVDYVDKDTGKNVYKQVPTAALSSFGGFGQAGSLAGSVAVGSVLGMGLLIGMPPTTLSLLQSKGNSKLLNKTQIHVLDGQSNTTKVGKSVPVRLGTQYGFSGYGGAIGTGGTGALGGAVNGAVNGALGGAIGGFGGYGGYPGIDSIQYRDVGLVIEATPSITNEGYVEVKMKFETSDVAASGSTSDLTPTFTQRSLQTVARIKDGVTSVVAGVNQQNKGDSRASIPVLGMVPILGRLFTTPNQTASQSDIVITVTPHIVRSAGITKEDYLAIYAGGSGTQGAGLPPSIEDVVYRAQQEEEQERRLVAQNSLTPQSVPLTPDPQAATTQAAVNQQSQPLVQQANNRTGNAPVRSQLDNRSLVPVANPNSSPAGVPSYQPTAPPIEQTSNSDAVPPVIPTGGISPNPTGEATPGKEGEMKEGEVLKPENPVQMATVSFAQDSEERRAKMEKFRQMYDAEQKRLAEEAKANKKASRVESAPAPLPEGISSPKTKVAQAMPSMPGARNNIGFTITAPNRQQMGKSFNATVEANGQGQMTGATLAIRFDDTKLQVKSVRGGEMFGQQPELSQSVEKGILKVSIKNPQKSAVSANGRVLVIEFAAISEGSTEIAFNNAETKVSLPNAASVLANGNSAHVVISRDAVSSATNER